MQPSPSESVPGGPLRRRRVRLALLGLLVIAAIAVAGFVVAVQLRPHLLTRVQSELRQVPGIGELPGIASAAPTATPAPTPPTVKPGATPNASFSGSADTIPLSRPQFDFTGSLPWQIRQRSGPGHVIEGYASAPSYLPGNTLRLAVSTTAPSWDARIFRVSGKQPASNPFVRVATIPTQAGRLQGAARVDPVTKMVWAPWSYTSTFKIPAGWPSGMYIVRLNSSQGAQSYVPFVVRSRSTSRYLVVSNALNWQAYNSWGGSSLYVSKVGEPLPSVTRALAVSFDRPYLFDGGAGQLFFLELPLISWLERQGLDVTFTTDYDLSIDPASQPLPGAVVFNGHGEYWGMPLRQWLETHVNVLGDLGLAVLAADTGYWPITLTGDQGSGPRIETCYKNGPLPAGVAAARTSAPAGSLAAGSASSGAPGPSPAPGTTPGEVAPGVTEEETGPATGSFPPGGPYVGHMPMQSLSGVDYLHVTIAMGRYSIAFPEPPVPFYAGTSLTAGSSLGFIAGGEVDGVYGKRYGADAGAHDRVFAQAANIPSRKGDTSTAAAVYRDLPNSGRVFASGTFYWGWALDPAFAVGHDVPADFGQLTRNILEWLQSGG